jgi:hypothetical protein
VVLRANEAGQPLYVVVLEQKMSKKNNMKMPDIIAGGKVQTEGS